MHIACIYDRINKWGGAERVLKTLYELWPGMILFTALYDQRTAPWAKKIKIITSVLQHIPFLSSRHEYVSFLTPFAFESMNIHGYDVLLSVTSAEAKGVITKPETLHICYCLTPTRYLWSGYQEYIRYPGFGVLNTLSIGLFTRLLSTLRNWDLVASKRPDEYVAISVHVAKRIIQYYGIKPKKVIYPPVDIEKFQIPIIEKKYSYFLVVSRLVGYKRVDIAVEACTKAQLPLIIVGRGRELHNLQRIAGPTVQFITTHLTDEELSRYYQGCRALIHMGVEDFGIVSVEAQACGKPVLSYVDSGMAETIIEKKTGLLLRSQSVDELLSVLLSFQDSMFDPKSCRQNSERFSKERFKMEMFNFVVNQYKKFRIT